MLDITENFISEFHNLNGVQIGERKKNLHGLLKKQSFSAEEEQSIIENLKPETYLETLFQIDILIYFKKTSQLIEILKNGNEVFVSKIIKQPWFFQEAFNNYTPEEFVQNLLPSMSFSVKMKLLKKLPLVFSEQQIDEVFDHIVDRYGLFIATSVAHSCSPKKIEHILKNNDVKLSTCQLKTLYKKQPNLIKIYLEEYKEEVEKRIDNCFLVFIAQRDPDLFCSLTKEYKKEISLRLGRRTTKQFINSKKKEIICEPKKYIQFLRNETFVRKLNKEGDLKKIYYILFPQDMNALKEASILSYTLLKFYPSHARYQLFTQTFESVFSDNVLANFNFINDYLLEVIGDRNFRENLAQLKYKETNDDKYLKYYKTGNCMKLLREKIHFTSSIKQRSQLIWLLLENCSINKDLEALKKVLEYFCERHRNDNDIVKREFLAKIDGQFDHKKFNETHWKYINEIIILLRLNPDCYPINPKLRVKYLEYLYQENKFDKIEPTILEYVKDEVKHISMTYSLPSLKNPEIEKKILLQAVQILPKAIEIENVDNVTLNLKIAFVSEIFAYNSRHPKNKINISQNQHIINFLRHIMARGVITYRFNETLVNEIHWLNRNDFENELVNFYWKNIFCLYPEDKILLWYVDHDPLLIVQHLEAVIQKVSQTQGKVYHKVKLYSHLNLDDMVVKYSTTQISTGNDYARKNWVQPLSILCTPEHYIQVIENADLIPTTPKFDLANKEPNYKLLTHKAVIKNFVNVKDPMKMLPFLIEKFCIGDYLETCLSPLYSCFHKSPENVVKPNLDKLLQKKHMSVRKHSLFFACSIFDQQTVLDILKIFRETKDSALHKRAFLSCMKYFSKSPSEEFLKQITFYTRLLQESDTESFLILSTTKIPRKFKPEYMQNIWNILETFKDNKNNKFGSFDKIFSPILDGIDKECLQKLPTEFCNHIIEKYFLINDEATKNDSVYKFVIKFLMCHEGTVNKFTLVFQILQKYKSEFWNKCISLVERNNIYQFFKTFYKLACEKNVTSEFIIRFKDNWESVFSPTDAFQEFIILNLLQFKKESHQNLEIYSEKIVTFSNKIYSVFEQINFSKFTDTLYQFIDCEEEKNRITLLLYMLKFDSTRLNCILVMDLIIRKGDLIYDNKIKNGYHDIHSILKMAIPNIPLNYNLYLNNISYFE